MPVSVTFSEPVTPARLSQIRDALGGIPCADAWSVTLSIPAGDETGVSMLVEGPHGYHRTFHLFDADKLDPDYFVVLLRAEINAYPARPSREYAFAIAQLDRLGIPYDDGNAFRGRVTIDGVDVPTEHLAHLYRAEMLTADVIHHYTRLSRGKQETEDSP